MLSFVNLKGICKILKFLYHDTFKGILSHSILKNRLFRNIFLLCAMLLYLLHFYWNMVHLASISKNINQIDPHTYLILGRITLISYYNMTIIIAIVISIFMKSTLHLTNRALYILKIIPLTQGEIHFSILMYRMSIALALFEFVFIIVAPGLKLLSVTLIEAILILVSIHILFIVTFVCMEILYYVILNRSNKKNKAAKKFLIDILLLFLVSLYLYNIRIKVESFLGNIPISILNIILCITFTGCILLAITLWLSSKIVLMNDMYLETKFLKVHLFLTRTRFYSVLYAIIRSKNYIYLLAMICIIIILSAAQAGINGVAQMLPIMLPIVSIGAISYADSTLNFRRWYPYFEYKPLLESKFIVLNALILGIPNLLLSLFFIKNTDFYFYALSIMFSAIMVGFLFPKSQSTINETVSSLIALIIVLLLALLANMKWVLLPVTILLICLLYFVLRREYEVIKCKK